MIKEKKYKSYILKWLNEKRKYIKESSYANYSYIVHNYVIPYFGNMNTKSIDVKTIQNFIFYMHDNGLSNKTIKDVVSVVKQSFINNSKININKRLHYPVQKKIKKMYILSINDQNKLMRYLINNPCGKNVGILIGLTLGVRIGEVCALKWKDVDFDNYILHIDKTIQRIYVKTESKNYSRLIIDTPKSYKSVRDIPINKEIINFLKVCKSSNEDYILTNKKQHLEPRSYRNYFYAVLKRLEIPKFNFHGLRHTFATNCILLGIDYKTTSELLGHANINTTINLYVHSSMEEKKKSINKVYKSLTDDM